MPGDPSTPSFSVDGHAPTSPRLPLARFLAWSLLALAALTLVVAFAGICIRTGSLWPWMRVVHEDGRHTLIGTIFYFEHATRELPLDIVLGIAIGGCVFYAFAPHAASAASRGYGRVYWLAGASVVVVAMIVGGAAVVAGPPSVVENLLQNHTRMGAALLWGSHWRYHLLERMGLMLVAIGFAGVLRYFSDGGRGSDNSGLGLAAAAVAGYLVLTAVFAHGPASMLQPFRDPQYLGHQAREVFTHGLVTLPAAWALCMLMMPRSELEAPWRRPIPPPSPTPAVIGAIAAGVLGLLMGGFVGVAALRSGATAHAQSSDLATLVFPHFFEHSFTYAVVPLVAALTYAIVAARNDARRAR